MNWHRKTWQPPTAPQRLSIDEFERPEVDGLAIADRIDAGQPMEGTLVMISASGLPLHERFELELTLADILDLPEVQR